MLRDPRKVHAILQAVQAYSAGEPVDLHQLRSNYSRDEPFGSMKHEEFQYHLELLAGGGFLRETSALLYQLTWDGHDLLEALDDEFDDDGE